MAVMTKKRDQFESRRSALEGERLSWVAHWKDCAQFIQPRRSRFLTTDRNQGKKLHSAIINSTATQAADILTQGLMAGLTSPQRPWFRLSTPIPDLNEFGPVKDWLHRAEVILYAIFRTSNYYDILPAAYEDLGVQGTAAMLIEEDFEDVIRCFSFPVGSYSLGLSGRLRVDSIYREEEMTAGQMVDAFGEDVVADSLVKSWESDDTEAVADIVHVIEPNDDRVPGKADYGNMAWRSVYYNPADSDNEFMSQKGYQTFPIMAPRWWVNGRDTYGRSPGMNALGDIRGLQEDERRKGKQLEMLGRPPMVAPQSMKRARISTVPGEVTYVPDNISGQRFEPAWTVNPSISPQLENINTTEERIKDCFHVNAILALLSQRHPQKTATEVIELTAEKAIVLGTAIGKVQSELLTPSVRRTLEIALRNRVIPPPPPEMVGAPLEFDYVSILAQAQKASGTVAVERLAGFVGSLAGAIPAVLDKVDWDQAVDEYGGMLNVSHIVRPDDDVEQMRQARAEEQAAQQAVDLAERGVQGAKVLSETEVGGSTALNELLGGAV